MIQDVFKYICTFRCKKRDWFVGSNQINLLLDRIKMFLIFLILVRRDMVGKISLPSTFLLDLGQANNDLIYKVIYSHALVHYLDIKFYEKAFVELLIVCFLLFLLEKDAN